MPFCARLDRQMGKKLVATGETVSQVETSTQWRQCDVLVTGLCRVPNGVKIIAQIYIKLMNLHIEALV